MFSGTVAYQREKKSRSGMSYRSLGIVCGQRAFDPGENRWIDDAQYVDFLCWEEGAPEAYAKIAKLHKGERVFISCQLRQRTVMGPNGKAWRIPVYMIDDIDEYEDDGDQRWTASAWRDPARGVTMIR